MHKGTRGHKITERQQRINIAISKTRYKVERTFGSMHRWYGTGIARYVGLSKTHTQHIVQSIVLVGGATGYIEKLAYMTKRDLKSLVIPLFTIVLCKKLFDDKKSAFIAALIALLKRVRRMVISVRFAKTVNTIL